MQVVSSRNSVRVRNSSRLRGEPIPQSAILSLLSVLRASVVNLIRQSAFRTPHSRSAFTLVEMMVAVALTLLMMTMVVSIFSLVMDNVSGSRATIEMTDKLRFVRERLQKDLAGVTVIPIPPRRPENGEGYFEYIEGSIGPCYPAAAFAVHDEHSLGDYTVGDNDDILLFTTKSQDEPFVGRYTTHDGNGNAVLTSMIESQVAEVAWFLRGTTLYRRVLLVVPSAQMPPMYNGSNPIYPLKDSAGNFAAFYSLYDISARMEDGPNGRGPGAAAGNGRLVPNTLGDLTNRQNRFGHQPYAWPFDARFWGILRLPTLRECSSPNWPFPWNDSNSRQAFSGMGQLVGAVPNQTVVPLGTGSSSNFNTVLNRDALNRVSLITDGSNADYAQSPGGTLHPESYYDAWANPMPWYEMGGNRSNDLAYYSGTRMADDVIMTNVLSFDVKIWDPNAPVLLSSDASEALVPNDRWVSGRSGIDDEYSYIERMRSLLPNVTPTSLGAFVDLDYLARLGVTRPQLRQGPVSYAPTTLPTPLFSSPSGALSGLLGAYTYVNTNSETVFYPDYPAMPLASVYDTWSTSYEQDGIDQDSLSFDPNRVIPDWKKAGADEGTNGIDDDGANGVDDPGEQEAPPPYASPLRAIQVKIRVFEPDSRQIREVTLEHEFLPQ